MKTHTNVSLTLQNLEKNFSKVQALALSGVSLHFEVGMLHGIIGPEAAGKTTLMRLLAGLLAPSKGTISYSIDGVVASEFETVRPLIAYMPERQSLYADLSIKEHLDFFSKLYELTPSEYKEKQERLLSITRLGGFLERPAGKLSGGMYKKLGLICALLRSPKVLLLDEPTNGVDPISRREFWELLYSLRQENILMLVSTAYMDEAERCSRAHLFQEGKLLFSGIPSELLVKHRAKDFNELFIKQAEQRVC
ncbi:MAG: ABC transporter ATP-binding protein [Oligoflexia bacterium]|nr:ABC transporter ATP-binding protein [Oligoflexia bacterium]MBF0365583.1 ABC transporter ATP-binding protein [Oligoflexia bacterium]